MIAMALTLFIACAPADDDGETGFVDPAEYPNSARVATKTWTIGGGGGTCAASADCIAIYFTGNVDGTEYEGFAARNYDGSVVLKAYRTPIGSGNWQETRIVNGTIDTYNTNNNNANDETDGTYSITLDGGTIRGQYYSR